MISSLESVDLEMTSENVQDIHQRGSNSLSFEEQPDPTVIIRFQVESWKV